MPPSASAPLPSSTSEPTLTPSETVLFGAARFATKSLLPASNDAPYSGADKVSVDQLARAMLRAAILGSERAGALRIDLHHSKALLGLMHKTSVTLAATGSEAAWPAGSLEAALAAGLRGGEVDAGSWLYDYLREDGDTPEREIVDEVRR